MNTKAHAKRECMNGYSILLKFNFENGVDTKFIETPD